MATFDNVDRYVYYRSTFNPSGDDGDQVNTFTCVFSFDSRNVLAKAIADHMVAFDDWFTISKIPPTPPVVIDTDDVKSMIGKIKSYRMKQKYKDARVFLSDYVKEAFEIDREILPKKANIIDIIRLTKKHKITVEQFVDIVESPNQIVTEAELRLDWSDPKVLEGFVSRAATFLKSQSKQA